jgi:hypothetical protein
MVARNGTGLLNDNDNDNDNPPFKSRIGDQIKSKMLSLKRLKNNIEKMTLNLGNQEDNLIGANRGLLMLQEAYDLNVLGMANGSVEYNGEVFRVRWQESMVLPMIDYLIVIRQVIVLVFGLEL